MRKEQNFEINLFPVISLLAVLISFLLLTAVWVNIGSIDVKQAVGATKITDKGSEKLSSLWLSIDEDGRLAVEVRDDNEKRLRRVNIKDSTDTFASAKSTIETLQSVYPSMKLGFVSASPKTPYQTVVKALETLKLTNFKDIGVIPL